MIRRGPAALVLCAGLALMGVALAQEVGGEEMVDGSVRDWQPNVDSYTLQPGDNLWNVTGRVVGKPWLWPRVWAMNPEITNPNWVYPGDIVRFFPTDQPLPSIGGGTSAQLAQADVTEIPAEGEAESGELVEVIDTKSEAGQAPAADRASREWLELVGSFITNEELAQAGVLTHSPEQKMLLSPSDEIYLTFSGDKRPVKGEKFLVYRTVRKVRHPKTKAFWGYMTQVTGVARVQEVGESVSRATLAKTFVEVERGQYVSPFDKDILAQVIEVPAGEAIGGYVLALGNELDVMAGANNVVFVDKGRSDGLVRGNKLSVIHSGDPIRGVKEGLPDVDVATLLVIDAKEKASTCLVLDSRREIEPGDRVRAITAKSR